jgi:prepilin-type processing-associated H-X9-DG protein
MMRKYHVRFGGGPTEKGLGHQHLAGGLPYNLNYRTWNDTDVVTGKFTTGVNGLGINLGARVQDVNVYLCPSDPSPTRRGANPTNTSDLTYPEGRLNYLGCVGATSAGLTGPRVGVFAFGTVSAGQTLKGPPLAAITDGTSNTALFAEVMRTTDTWPHVAGRTNTMIMLDSSVSQASDSDGRTAPTCASGNPWSLSLTYMGLQFERFLWGTTFYTHTLPPNWNKNRLSGNQSGQYNCGDTNLISMHIAASSYHPGGVNLVLADGSVRFVAESIDFATWQAVGTLAGGEVIPGEW